uniref:Uncharacterized protein n=1 Tax=Arundo donax TaxID=35708 RepID=A0A0A9EP73_ARUDO
MSLSSLSCLALCVMLEPLIWFRMFADLLYAT